MNAVIRKEAEQLAEMQKLLDILKSKHTKIGNDGDKMLQRVEDFCDTQTKQARATRSILDTKEFHRPELLQLKFDSLIKRETEAPEARNIRKTVREDMKSIDDVVGHKHYLRCMENIVKTPWFSVCISKLQEAANRKGQPIPLSCLKFLGVLKCLFMVGRDLTPELFYYVMERTVAKEDHIHLVVYKTLKYAMDAVRISPDSFLDYLEEHDIQPCAEHLALIRRLRKQRLIPRTISNTHSSLSNHSFTTTKLRYDDIQQRPGSDGRRLSGVGLAFDDDVDGANIDELYFDDDLVQQEHSGDGNDNMVEAPMARIENKAVSWGAVDFH